MNVDNCEYVGVDNGTTTSSVCVVNQIETKMVKFGTSDITPSIVQFPTQEELEELPGSPSLPPTELETGYRACEDVTDAVNILHETKRLIGMKYDNEHIQELILKNHFESFKIVCDKDGWVMLAFYVGDRVVTKYPWEISAMVLKHLREQTQRHNTTQTPIKAVVSVPAYFTHFQRADTIKACKRAGLYVIRLINEPTAAAIANLMNTANSRERVLVFDFGGGTLDVTVMDMKTVLGQKTFQVKSSSGDTFLGGTDFDREIAQMIIDKIQATYGHEYHVYFDEAHKKDSDLRIVQHSKNAVRKLAKEEKERDLWKHYDDNHTFTVSLNSLGDKFIDKKVTLDSEEFARKTEYLFQRCMVCVERALSKANIGKDTITKVLMVGGSSKFEEVRRRLYAFFDGRVPIQQDTDYLLSVAKGAGHLAFALASGMTNFLVHEVCPLSLGMLHVRQGTNTPYIEQLIRASEPIPATRSIVSETHVDNQDMVSFCVYQGDETVPVAENFIASFHIKNLPKRKKGEVRFKELLSYDQNGMVTVGAEVTHPRGVKLNGKARCVFSMAGVDISREGTQSFDVSCEDYVPSPFLDLPFFNFF